MSDMKCPICGEKLVKWIGYADDRFWTCNNVLCEAGRFGHIADECIWQELIRTRKALEIAKTHLGYIKNNYHSWTPYRDEQMIAQASNCLAKIKELEDDNL